MLQSFFINLKRIILMSLQILWIWSYYIYFFDYLKHLICHLWNLKNDLTDETKVEIIDFEDVFDSESQEDNDNEKETGDGSSQITHDLKKKNQSNQKKRKMKLIILSC